MSVVLLLHSSMVDLPETLTAIKKGAFSSLVAVIRGNPEIGSQNIIDVYYSDGSNIISHAQAIKTYPPEIHTLCDLPEEYDDFKNCGITKRNSVGIIIGLME